jgi:EAL domain-containing protein (putative c-di-GMP-specific phosphodiesterase class I)/GGDEF domain-containing protein
MGDGATDTYNKGINKSSLLGPYYIAISSGVYLFSIWFLPKVDAYISWAVFSSLLLLVSLSHIVVFSRQAKINTARFYVQWLLMAAFSGAIFLWVNTQLSFTWLVQITVFTYVVSLINGSWLLVQYIHQQLKENKQQNIIPIAQIDDYSRDPATNLPCYKHALTRLDVLLKSPQKKEGAYAVIVFKPINFHQVNLVLGHHNSDILLLQLAYNLQKSVVDNTSLTNFDSDQSPIRIARLQSLNFLVVLDLNSSQHPTKAMVDNVCQQLFTAVPNAMSFKSFSLNFELAFGIAITGEHGANISKVICHAEDALLDAEKEQRMISYFDIKTAIYAEQQLVKMERLKQDIIADKLHWYIQPQINLTDRRIKGFELLVHWYYEDNKPLTLSEFIKIAEHSGEMYVLTKHMFTQAFNILIALQKFGVHQPLSVNLASKDLLEPELIDFIGTQIKHFNIPTKYLMVELNEDIMLTDCSRTKDIIDQLKSLDIGIAIDDFSGSYESLRYLRKMAVNQIKIDCRQITNDEDNRADKAIINTLINLTRKMNIPLIGLNIDNKAIETAFVAMGGEFAQGNVINPGVVLAELDIWLTRWLAEYPETE